MTYYDYDNIINIVIIRSIILWLVLH